MFDMDGKVIGINTAIFSPSGGSIGIGFALPSSLAKGVIAQLRQFGHARRGWLGVRIQSVTPELAEGLKMARPMGALIAAVTEGGPAAKAGIKQGDVVISFNGQEIAEMRHLPRIVAETPYDTSVPVTVLRQGKQPRAVVFARPAVFVAGPAQQGGVQVVQLQTARQMIQPDVLVAFAAVDRPHAQSVLQEKPKRTFRRFFELRDLRVNLFVPENVLVHQVFDIEQVLLRKRRVVREVEAQAVGRDE